MNRLIYSFIVVSAFYFKPDCMAQEYSPNLVTYESYRGTLGTYPIQLHYTNKNGAVSGNYFYEKVGSPISLTGNIKGQVVKLTAEINNKKETFTLTSSDQKLSGTWVMKAAGKSLPVTLTRLMPAQNFSLYNFSDSILLFPDRNTSPRCQLKVNTIWPSDSDEQNKFLRYILISEFFKDKKFRHETDAVSIYNEYKNNVFEMYRSDNKDLKAEEVEENSFSFNMEQDIAIDISYSSPTLLSLNRSEYQYSGGAHGNTMIDYINLDLVQKKRLKLEDIFTKNGLQKLPSLIENQFRKDNKLQPGVSLQKAGLFENKITQPSQAFYVTNKRIGFLYNQYEIAPYAMGAIIVELPYSSLTGLLQPSFIKLIQ
jgi:hypothetical protein